MFGQKQYEMVTVKTDGSTIVTKTSDIDHVFFREITSEDNGGQGDNQETFSADRTVLVYMSGENSLSSYTYSDLSELTIGSKNIGNNNLIVYVDNSNSKELPWLAKLENGKVTDSVSVKDMNIQPTKGYVQNDPYASDPSVMEEVIRYTINKYPSKTNDYALAFFGHGCGWLIKDSIEYTSMVRRRAYGIDNGKNTTSDAGKWLNIPSMAKMLAHFPRFSYIFFDCCNMQGLEVAYELRNVTDYIIGSPAEIPDNGAPYITVAPAMMEKTTFWKSIVDRYYEQRDGGFDVPLSVIKTSEMENLASATRTILSTISHQFGGDYPNLSGLIHYYYDSSSKRQFFDANDFVLKFALTDDYKTWKQAFDRAVIYKKMATEWMINKSSWARYYGNYFEVNEEKYGGVSMFIPQWSYQTTDNKYIQQMGWYYAAGYQDIGW